ncbi:hypothetical protein LIER_43574 [Lithospermum erythrorhizon]|uniref:Reverse transcriptase domain-containing protein n=1 Tax=Lithospermum erythrorhizon TaxID=34254 RepID=A0AAV3QEM6_LITER
MPRRVNNTVITLIPKVQQPQTMKEFRPIVCCNTVYKRIATILANRLKATLSTVIGEQQTTCVPRRNILDGILLMQEMVCGYHKSSERPRCALKIDIMKTYDTIKWSFLWTVMRVMGYPERASEDLGKGTLYPPYLFIIVMEVFTKLLRSQEKFHYHPKCEEISLINVSFIDDLFFLSCANVESMRLIKKVLADFGKLSRLLPNLSKSSRYFAGVTDQQASRLSGILGIPIFELPVRYLGISLTTKN